jgi:hypothetical protein
LRKNVLRNDKLDTRRLFDRLLAFAKPPPQRPIVGATPIFIVGLPRTGSTLLERILGAHPMVAEAGELHDFIWEMRWVADLVGGPQLDLALADAAEAIDFCELGQRYLSKTQWRVRDTAFFTDKMPTNFLNVGYILAALPNARILHTVRDPMDTCFSNLKEYFAGGFTYSYDQEDVADYYSLYRRLMEHWHAAYPGRIHDVSYERLVADPLRVTSEVLDFCGLPQPEGGIPLEGRAGIVATASAVQVRQSIHARSVGQWRRYERYLGPLKARLEFHGC